MLSRINGLISQIVGELPTLAEEDKSAAVTKLTNVINRIGPTAEPRKKALKKAVKKKAAKKKARR